MFRYLISITTVIHFQNVIGKLQTNDTVSDDFSSGCEQEISNQEQME